VNYNILLGYKKVAINIRGKHFCITFNEVEHLILKVHCSFTWILDLRKKDNSLFDVKVHIPQNGLAFKIQFACHKACQAEYANNLAGFIEASYAALSPLYQLGIDSQPSTAEASQGLTLKQHPVYINQQLFGKGAFGAVNKIINMSSASIYARKTFFKPH
jgi:hypothetical protein